LGKFGWELDFGSGFCEEIEWCYFLFFAWSCRGNG